MSPTKIAVATDFSARADRAIDRAKLLRDEMGGALCFIHATNLPGDDAPPKGLLEQKMRLATGVDEAGEGIEFAFPAGLPTNAIARVANSGDVNLLLIGPARYNTLVDWFLGTAVDHVLRHAQVPVIVVKTRAHGPYRQIVAGTDFSAGSAHAILTAARMFPDADFHIVHGWHMPFQGFQKDAYVADEIVKSEQAKMADFVAGLAAEEPRLAGVATSLVKGGPIEAVRYGLELAPEALAVVGSHGAGGFEQATIGSVTSDLLRVIEADTMVVSTRDAK